MGLKKIVNVSVLAAILLIVIHTIYVEHAKEVGSQPDYVSALKALASIK